MSWRQRPAANAAELDSRVAGRAALGPSTLVVAAAGGGPAVLGQLAEAGAGRRAGRVAACSAAAITPPQRPAAADMAMAAAMVAAPALAEAGQRAGGCAAAVVAALAGAAGGRIDAVGLVQLGLFAAAAAWLPATPLGALGVCAAAAPLITHRCPGFRAWRPFGEERLRSDAVPYAQTISPDKHIVGALIWLRLAHTAGPVTAPSAARVAAVAAICVGNIAALMGAGLATGYVALDPAPPPPVRSLLWLVDNLALTCVAEEGLFRGLLQPSLTALAGGGAWASAASLAVSATLFGLGHAAGGRTYVALSALAGVGYGAAAAAWGHAAGGVVAHLALNALHFFAFSYPARDRHAAAGSPP